jgi:hypothetical protein
MVNIVITIPADKVEELKLGFLKVYPIPTDRYGVPLYTEMEWAIYWIKKQLFEAYKEGKKMIAFENANPQIDEGVVL